MAHTREHLTCEGVGAALRELHGNMAAVARKYGVTRTAVKLFVDRHPTLIDVVRECREGMKDNAESSLQRALLAGEAWAVCFYLKCQAKDRGYVERTEHEHEHRGEVTLRVTRLVVDAATRSNSNGHAASGAGGLLPE